MASSTETAALNAEQNPGQVSAPAPQVTQNEITPSDAGSYTTGGLNDSSSFRSGPSGVIIDRNEGPEPNTTDEQATHEPGTTITVNPPITQEENHDDDEAANGTPSSSKEKLKRHKNLSKKEQKIVVFGGVGTLNLLALGAVGYWGYKRYSNGESGWKVLGIAAGIWAGVTAFEWISVRGFSTWKRRKDKSS